MNEANRPAIADAKIDPVSMIKPKREIMGMSAILLPYTDGGDVDWAAFDQHVTRTVDAGLVPAVNMDTGYVNLLDDSTKAEVLSRTQKLADHFVAGAFVGDRPGTPFALREYCHAMEQIESHGGTPVIFQSFGLTQQSDDKILDSYLQLAAHCDQFIGFELGRMFAPFGKIYSPELYRGLMRIEKCLGAKHSSLDRIMEWERLQWRDELRPDFRVFTGNDLAIDMVMYGSDYLLGLSTFAPDLFAARDQAWLKGDPSFYQLNDGLQYLGFFGFREPVPAYKHSAAMFLKIRGWVDSDRTHPASPTRPASDRLILGTLAEHLGI